MLNRLPLTNLAGDLAGGLTAAVVALPLALAFGIASGAGALAGLYGAIWTGLFAALFGGTKPQITGPTGPMTVVTAALFTRYAATPDVAFTIIMLGGVVQILSGWARLGRYITLMPYEVISGFMTGIGGIILIVQLAPLLGHRSPPEVLNDLVMLPHYLADVNLDALALGLIAIAIAFGLRGRVASLFPPPLAALLVGSLLGVLVFTDAPVIGAIPSGWPSPHLPVLPPAALVDVLVSAMILGLLGSIDSLLTSVVADNITRGEHDSDRELRGQGIANLVAGALGALPGAGATMRTIANVKAGGRTELSGVIHSLILLLVLVAFAPLAEQVPLAVLAGLLVKVGIDIVDWRYLRRIRTAPIGGVVLMVTVALLTIFVDLITAVAAGTVMASLMFVKRMADLQLEGIRSVEAEHHELDATERGVLEACGDAVTLVSFSGPLSFGVATGMVRRVNAFRRSRILVLDLSEVPMVDSSASIALEQIINTARDDGIYVVLAGMSLHVARIFAKLGILHLVKEVDRRPTRLEALEHCRALLETGGASAGSAPLADHVPTR
ncbi:MAG: SulP family inorganic anion transporter [Pseudomonadales bacterium]